MVLLFAEPCAMWEVAGTAGVIAGRPFRDDGPDGLALCAEEPPTTTGGEGLEPVAIRGVEAGFLDAPAAEAYEGAAAEVFGAWEF